MLSLPKSITGQKVFIKLKGIKGSIAKEAFGINYGMLVKKIFQSGDKQPGVMDTFVFIRGIGSFLNNDIWMRNHKVFVIKGNMTNDAQSVSDNAKLEDVAKMAIDVKLFDFRIGRGM